MIPAIYNQIKQVRGFEESIVAGGYLRDIVLGGTPNDLDIAVPISDWGQNEFIRRVEALRASNIPGLSIVPVEQFTDQYHKGADFLGKFDATWTDEQGNVLEIDICGHNKISDDFASDHLNCFDFDINKVYSNGGLIITTPEFDNDFANNTCTLAWIYHDDPNQLPHYIGRYLKLKEKYPHLEFRSKYALFKILPVHQDNLNFWNL